jgi:hypothetical protein
MLSIAVWFRDIIIIMLGTNDAKDAGSKGPHNWLVNHVKRWGSNALFGPEIFSLSQLASFGIVDLQT